MTKTQLMTRMAAARKLVREYGLEERLVRDFNETTYAASQGLGRKLNASEAASILEDVTDACLDSVQFV